MKLKAVMAARLFLGLIFFVFGLNGFLMFITPPPLTAEAGALLGAMIQSGYFMPMVKIVEIVGGVLLLSGFYVPFALVWLTPVIVNIFFFHTILDRSGAPIAVVIMAVHVFLVWSYREYYRSMFVKKAVAK